MSESVPNMFEESKSLNITYHKINIEDNEDVPIQMSFNLAFDFIEKAISPKRLAKSKIIQTNFDVLTQFMDNRKQSASLVHSVAKTNNILLDLCGKTAEDIPNSLKDKIYEIDMF